MLKILFQTFFHLNESFPEIDLVQLHPSDDFLFANGSTLARCLCSNSSLEHAPCESHLLEHLWIVRDGPNLTLSEEVCEEDEPDEHFSSRLCGGRSMSLVDSEEWLGLCEDVILSGFDGSGGSIRCYQPTAEWEALLDDFKYYVSGVIVCIISVFGFLANVVTVLVLATGRNSETVKEFNRLLVSLAVVDALQNLNMMLNQAVIHNLLDSSLPYWYCQAYGYVIHPLSGMVRTASIYMVVAVAAERYGAVTNPLR